MAEPRVEQLVASIESAMQQATALHGELLSLLLRKREALGAGDTGAMVELCRLENEKVQQISELEKSRLELAARLTLLLAPDAPEPMHLRDLALRCPEPMRARLLTQRQKLRQRMQEVREQTSITRRATEALSRHVNGLIQTIQHFAAGGAAYNDRAATPQPQHATLSTINLVA